ncbi:MAG: type II toxin-antitoxin system mRNA interferase toxin, RelE/StbE family [Candidatus Omnitrophica bacterium]|nr:type II toxin-antitoxin system mRNA interferase toxin, RelE/StbE family [Candidatus Omnitrophota bacterium]
MWRIQEHKDIAKLCRKLPEHIVKKYEVWKNIVFRHGPGKLKEFPGLHDEALKGERKGKRSSRLSLQYHVVYTVRHDIVTVYVLEITPHRY